MENTEKISSDKVRERVKQDGYEATKKAIGEATDALTKRGFNASQVRTLIKEGARKAANE